MIIILEDKILAPLDPEQLAAVTATEGYIRLIAGAGSGKTRALAHRYAYLVDSLGISPSAIACVTFTNKAAAEMKRRIRSLVGELDTGLVCTFHRLGRQICQEDINTVGYPKSFMVADREDSKTMAKQVMDDLGLTLRDVKINHFLDDIVAARKGKSISYVELLSESGTQKLDELISDARELNDKLFFRFLREQKRCFALDFDDLIYFPLHIFSVSQEALRKWQDRLQYIMVDEFQDVDGAEYKLIEKLSARHRNLFIVGDPDQTIYTWRGADVRHILNFPSVFPGAKTLMLTSNYRCAGGIVSAAQSLIEHNRVRHPKKLVARREPGVMPVFSHESSEKSEAEYICRRIKFHIESGVAPGDIAILYRSHYVSRALEEQLLRNDIDYRIYGGVGFYERREIKDALGYLRMIVSGDDLSLARIVNLPRRGFGKSRVGQLRALAESRGLSMYDTLKECVVQSHPLVKGTKMRSFVELIEELRDAAQTESVSRLLDMTMTRSGYEDMLRADGDQERLDNLAELKQAAQQFELEEGEAVSLDAYIAAVSLMSDADEPDAQRAVKLMTAHTAKGLEFPVVFVAQLCEGVFPSKRTNTREKMEEERRLAYVAMTRARDWLYLTDSEGFALDSNMKYPSRFIFDIDSSMLDYERPLSPEMVENAQSVIAASERAIDFVTLEPGTRIDHPILGSGTITAVDQPNSCYKVKFDSGVERSISIHAGFLRG